MVEHRYSDLFLTAREALRPTQGENAANCARELLAAAAGKTTAEIIASRDIYAPADVAEALSGMLARMQRDEPLAYVLGEWDFAGMTLEVTPEVVIPRDDTMAVTELALACAGQLPDHPRILDLCAGSGCIGLAIAQRIPDAHVILGDVSPGALRVARKNIGKQKLQSRVTAMALDATRPAMRFIGKFHLIVSNPPYIPSGQLPTLDLLRAGLRAPAGAGRRRRWAGVLPQHRRLLYPCAGAERQPVLGIWPGAGGGRRQNLRRRRL